MAQILKRNTLSYTNFSANSNKYYTMELIDEGGGVYSIFTQYGRIGTVQSQSKEQFYDYKLAERKYNSTLSSKLKKGYTEKDLATYSVGSAISKNKIDMDKVVITDETKKHISSDDKTSKGKKEFKEMNPLVEKFVKQIFDEASIQLQNLGGGSGTFKNNGSSPLGKLSLAQINEGRKILSKIATEKDDRIKLLLCEEYFKVIPKVFSSRISLYEIDISSQEKLSEQSAILDFYEEALTLKEFFDNTDDSKEELWNKYQSLCSEIKPLDKDSKTYKRICEKIKNDESPAHNIHISVKNIYSVKQKNAVEFDSSCGNVKELYHGTRSANIPAILASNLKMPKTLKGVYITGAMFGPGIYFANSSTKSSQYSCSRFGGATNKYKTKYMFIADVALGKYKKEYSANYYHSVPQGYNSVKGCKGSSLMHDEFIIYNENQQRLKYIVEFDTYKR